MGSQQVAAAETGTLIANAAPYLRKHTSKARIYLYPTNKSGRHTPIVPGNPYRPELFPPGSTQKFRAEIRVSELVSPGQASTVNIRLPDKERLTFKKGDRFTVWEGDDPDIRELAKASGDEVSGKGLGAVGELEIL